MPRTSASARPLTDHEEIRRWAEERDAKPACVRRIGGKNDIGMIRLDFPGYSGESSLEEISWEDWFQKFDESNLALLVQDKTARGQKSNFNKLVSKETAEVDDDGGSRTTSHSSRSNSASKTRSASAERSVDESEGEDADIDDEDDSDIEVSESEMEIDDDSDLDEEGMEGIGAESDIEEIGERDGSREDSYRGKRATRSNGHGSFRKSRSFRTQESGNRGSRAQSRHQAQEKSNQLREGKTTRSQSRRSRSGKSRSAMSSKGTRSSSSRSARGTSSRQTKSSRGRTSARGKKSSSGSRSNRSSHRRAA